MKKTLFNDGWNVELPGGERHAVTLPHDAMQALGRAADAPSGNGEAHYLGGAYEYCKDFELAEKPGRAVLEFDGVYAKSKVYVNDVLVGECAYGYRPFLADASAAVRAGANSVRVVAENDAQPNSRWYTGSGIYRSVWLHTGGDARSGVAAIEPFGVRVQTMGINPPQVSVAVTCGGEAVGAARVRLAVLDGECEVATAEAPAAAAARGVLIDLPGAEPWSAEHPKLYRAHVELVDAGGALLDTSDQDFGIRTIAWDATGFYVNGERALLRGGCIHHDNGILGAASLPEAEERRLRILKEGGFNAVRSSHNPASAALLDACDRLGMYVMDEGWDMWYLSKTAHDYGRDHEAGWEDDVEAMVRHDFNHPSVVMYSIGNENTEPAEARGVELGRAIVEKFHALDATRPVTIGLNLALVAMAAMGTNLVACGDSPMEKRPAAVNSTVFNETVSQNNKLVMASCVPQVDAVATPMLDEVDIAGYNYGAPRYPLDATEHPGRVVVGTETFPCDLARTWKVMEGCPYVIGDFMWTAWDYLGECGIGCWTSEEGALEFDKPYPWKLAGAGAYDLAGQPTGEALLAEAVWLGRTRVGVRPVAEPWEDLARGTWRGTNAIPSWSWAGCEGKKATVEVFTPGARVELYVNGALAAASEVEDRWATMDVTYEPGELLAVAYDAAGEECGRDRLVSAGEDLALRVTCESAETSPGDVVFFDVALADAAGNVESNRDGVWECAVTGGELLGFGSAAPRTEAEFIDGRYPSRYGRALAAVRVGKEGKVEVRAAFA